MDHKLGKLWSVQNFVRCSHKRGRNGSVSLLYCKTFLAATRLITIWNWLKLYCYSTRGSSKKKKERNGEKKPLLPAPKKSFREMKNSRESGCRMFLKVNIPDAYLDSFKEIMGAYLEGNGERLYRNTMNHQDAFIKI